MVMKFTKEQAQLVLNAREQFNRQQEMLAQQPMLIGNAQTLPKDVWGEWDREGRAIQRSLLAVYNDLAASVTKNMPIGKLIHYFQRVGDSGGATVSLDGRAEARTDQPSLDYIGTPLPIITDKFSYGWRQMEAARTEGYMLDDAGRANSMRKVAEKLESIVLNGDSTIVVGGSQLYGLRNHPKRNTGTHGLDLNGATGAQWLAAIKDGVNKLHGDYFFGETVTVYVNYLDWYYASSTDYSSSYSKTILQRLQEIGGVTFVPASSVNANELLFVVKNTSTVQLLNGMPLTVRPLTRLNPEDDYVFSTIAAAALEIKYDANDNCGVVQLTKA